MNLDGPAALALSRHVRSSPARRPLRLGGLLRLTPAIVVTERFTRTSPTEIRYAITVADASVHPALAGRATNTPATRGPMRWPTCSAEHAGRMRTRLRRKLNPLPRLPQVQPSRTRRMGGSAAPFPFRGEERKGLAGCLSRLSQPPPSVLVVHPGHRVDRCGPNSDHRRRMGHVVPSLAGGGDVGPAILAALAGLHRGQVESAGG